MNSEIKKFLDFLEYEKNASTKTLESYGKDLFQFNGFLQNEIKSYDEHILDADSETAAGIIDSNHIRAFIEFCYDLKLKKTSIKRKIATLKSFFKFLYNHGHIDSNPAEKIIFPRSEKPLPKFLYLKQVESILGFPLNNFIDYRDRALLELFYSSGARVSELAAADIEYLDIEEGLLRIMGKGGEERVVFLTGETSKWISIYLKERLKKFNRAGTALIVNHKNERMTARGIFYIIEKRARNAGIMMKVSPHTFRHSFATELLNRGADIRAVQEMLGHKHLSTTQVYTHTTQSRLREVYDKCHPHARGSNEQ